MTVADRAEVARLLEVQAEGCRVSGSALYHHLLTMAARDVVACGPTWDVLGGLADPRRRDAAPLRLMAAVHRLVLDRRAPQLSCFYPSVGGTADIEAAWPAFRALVVERRGELRQLVAQPCQTNEVGRAAALLPGFLLVAHETGLPLRLLEIGTSAGLNLRWDDLFFDAGYGTWGPPSSPVQLRADWGALRVELDGPVAIAERRGCDLRPVDPTTAEGRLTLTAAVWSDQLPRFECLRGALRLAQDIPARVDAARAGSWLPEQLTEPVPGMATVVFHSVVLQYLEDAERTEVRDAIREAGARATPEAPVAWLSLEPDALDTPGTPFFVDLETWPGGRRRRLTTARPHGC
jgi:hypothetical protein